MSALGAMDPTPGVGIEALELFVEVLSQSDRDSIARDGFYDRLCEAVCRMARMRRAVIFRYDSADRRVRAAGAHNMDIDQFAGAYVTVDTLSIAARALHEDRVVEVEGDLRPPADRAFGVILADRLMSAPPLDDADRRLLWTLGKAAALASAARIASTQVEKARQLEQRIDLAREIHEGVIQRLFGVSMALDGDGDLPERARHRCASETQAALGDLRAALQRPLGRAPRATRTTLTAEMQRLAAAHPQLHLALAQGSPADDVPTALGPLAHA